jgi:hypothetical protein
MSAGRRSVWLTALAVSGNGEGGRYCAGLVGGEASLAPRIVGRLGPETGAGVGRVAQGRGALMHDAQLRWRQLGHGARSRTVETILSKPNTQEGRTPCASWSAAQSRENTSQKMSPVSRGRPPMAKRQRSRNAAEPSRSPHAVGEEPRMRRCAILHAASPIGTSAGLPRRSI